uniref:Uncharacterized protein n=1 Tax=Leersia perrieri TaxID=77586 RepID=A0A0D9XGV3_9ORYZ
MAGSATMPSWSDLPGDLLREISGHICDAADYVRCQAVCKHWRDAVSPPPAMFFFPWIVGPCIYQPWPGRADNDELLFRSVSLNATFRVPRDSCLGETCSVRATDGAGGRVLAVGSWHGVSLVNPLTGDTTLLPWGFPDHIARCLGDLHGAVTGDGTVLLYTGYRDGTYDAAIHRPGGGDEAWTSVANAEIDHITRCQWGPWRHCATYHDGKVFQAGSTFSLVEMLTIAPGDKFAEKPEWRSLPRVGPQSSGYGYFFDLAGEMMWAYVDAAPPLVVKISVYSLEKDQSGGERWVKRDDAPRLLSSSVLFLGGTSSFAVEAAQLAGHHAGGEVYLMIDTIGRSLGYLKMCRVYRYRWEDDTVAMVDEANRWISPQYCNWFVPRPTLHVASHPPLHQSS